MTPAPERREKPKTQEWCTPPPGTALNAPVPHTASTFQRALTPFQYQLYRFIKTFIDPAKSEQVGRPVFRAPGYSAIARHFNVARETVYRNAGALVRKKCWTGVYERLGEHGREGTWYVDRPWEDVLEARRADPAIAKTSEARPLVIGKGRRWMSPEEAAAWQIRLDGVPASAEIGEAAEEEPAATPPAPAETPVSAPPAAAPATQEDDDVNAAEKVHQALLDVCTSGADQHDVETVIKAAIKVNRDRPIHSDALAQMIRAIGRIRRKVAPRAPITVGLVLKLIPSQVHAWRNEELQRRAEEARRATRHAEMAPAEEVIAEYERERKSG